jgi:membrane fusion protein (multidrug efflux system)
VTRQRSVTTGCAALLLAATLVSWGCNGSSTPAAADPAAGAPTALVVQAAPVRAQEWIVAVPISGTLRSQSNVEVKAEVAGRLIQTFFEEGDSVAPGQVLAEIDPTNYQLAQNQAQAALEVAEAGLGRVQVTLEHAQREKERADNLLRTGGITEKDHLAAVTSVKEVETQLRLAEAQCSQARAALAIAEKTLKDCRIASPAGGRVQQKFYHTGSLLVPGSSICTLVDNTRLELECSVPSYLLSEVGTGQLASFTTPTYGERRFQGRVHSVNPMVDAQSRSVKVILKISNPGEELRSGMFARGEIQVRREARALVIPRSAFVAEEAESASGRVYIVEQGVARRRAVSVGDSHKDLLYVRGGLREGDLVIVDIGPALKDGTRVRPAVDNSTGR